MKHKVMKKWYQIINAPVALNGNEYVGNTLSYLNTVSSDIFVYVSDSEKLLQYETTSCSNRKLMRWRCKCLTQHLEFHNSDSAGLINIKQM
ncbi:hypothetical protein QQG55_41820 [Brugia pahangi]